VMPPWPFARTSVSNTEQAIYPTCFSAYLKRQHKIRSAHDSLLISARIQKSAGNKTLVLLVDRYQVSSLFVPKLHVVAQHVDVQQLPHILLFIILCRRHTEIAGAEYDRTLCCYPSVELSDAPDRTLAEANFLRILPSSLSTRNCSCSLLEQFLMSDMKTCT